MQRTPYSVTKRIGAPPWRGKRPLLHSLDIELTERCNNNCIHCCINLPANDTRAKARELSTHQIQDILSEAASLGCLKVRFTGGEPLLREDFEDLYIFARKLGMKVLIFTNATLITPYMVRLFVRVPPLEKIEVSLYGMKKSTYEAVSRKRGSFKAAWRGIRLLLKNGIPFVVKSALLPPIKAEVENFERWAATLPWMDAPPSYSLFFDLRCRQEEQKNRLIRRLRIPPEEGVRFLARRPNEFQSEIKQFCAKFIGPQGRRLFTCGAGQGHGCVDAYGVFQPCLMLRHPHTVYDLKKGSLRAALTEFFPRLSDIQATNPEYLARCARCFLKGLCEQCPAKSWTEHGTLDTPVEYFCQIAHAQARYLGLLKTKEKAWKIKNWRRRLNAFLGQARK